MSINLDGDSLESSELGSAYNFFKLSFNKLPMTVTQDRNNFSIFAILQSNLPKHQIALQFTWTVFRILVCLLMIHNGLDKLADVQGFATNVVTKIGLPYPMFFTYCAAYVEIVGAILLALGLLTRLNATALLFTMLVAIYFHLKVDGLQIRSFETASLYALSFLSFLVNGGGNYSVDGLIVKLLVQEDRSAKAEGRSL
jgi:putative oxidoreductase